ncbi:hypothetical protein SMACR_00473 [Sordaria macrospora]|uniref:WGS project CABT00000000 data, contig 2.1 n=2 Tax=Sordaria macrospora TaxID=5147 RepID=F7VL79_SORMK|nr:uncharacterized protein SMAC_00473 [Sordaria macrospora k-hell]KAA8635377.1 hypothetical protein SMACR_00473 [Sordaria macrospora]WPJ59224.1 hypothetical protein SMAC4_00473 [Sordaria macrospora]CCC06256.1 unnamed protein product [Sordaria macrospora k-hell]
MAYQQTESAPWRGVTRSPPNYTRVDYGRFPDSVPPLIPIGQTSKIGKVEVDCRFLCSRSRWGKMSKGGPENPQPSDTYPAGILYLDLAFRQPADCRLQSATIAVTLGRDDDALHRSEPAVFMTGHFGPGQLSGPKQTIQTRQLDELIPTIGIGNLFEVGGVGRQKEKLQTIADSWRFSGHLRSVDGCPNYNRLEWFLDECSLEKRPTHGSTFHTAFAIGHNARAFHLTVEVTGTLARKRDKFKSWSREIFKFGGSKHTPQKQASIQFQWSNGYSATKFPLDMEAQYLSQTMDEANIHSIPMVIPEPQQATFYPATHREATTDTRTTSVHHDNVASRPTASDNIAEARIPRLQADTPPRLLGLTNALPNLMPSTHESMARAAGLDFVGGSDSPEHLDSPNLLPRSAVSSTTLVDNSQDSESPWEFSPAPRRTMERQAKTNDAPSTYMTMEGKNHPSDTPPMDARTLLGLLVAIWELISAMLGVAAFPGKAVRMEEAEDGKENDTKRRNIGIQISGQRGKHFVEDSETETPGFMASDRAWQNRRKDRLERRWT